MSDLERRAEELVKWLLHFGGDYQRDAANAVEQLLSENRQVRAELETAVNDPDNYIPNEDIRMTQWKLRAEAAEASYTDLSAQFDLCSADYHSAQSTIAQQKQDLDRISAEREAYREAAQYLAHCVETDLPLDRPSATRTRSALASLRRILAENDR